MPPPERVWPQTPGEVFQGKKKPDPGHLDKILRFFEHDSWVCTGACNPLHRNFFDTVLPDLTQEVGSFDVATVASLGPRRVDVWAVMPLHILCSCCVKNVCQ